MTAMQRVRSWAEDNGHEIKLERKDAEPRGGPNDDPETVSDGAWRMFVSLEESVRFEAASGWQDTVETAARLVLEQLIAVGEDIPE
jgi:hypothetical protein